jgi:hypothetical protein
VLKVGVIHSVRAVVCCNGTVPSLLVIKRSVHVLVVCLLTCWFLLVSLSPGVDEYCSHALACLLSAPI